MRLRILAVLALALPAALLAAPPPAGGADADAPYHQKVTWAGCSGLPGGALTSTQCATLTVPKDYARPEAGKLDLAVSRIKASGPGPRLGSLLVNFGGPGVPGIAELAQLTAAGELAWLNTRYDLVGFDPRGVGRSTPVDCGDLTDVTATGVVAQARQVARDCQAHSADLLPYVGTANAAHDLDVIRAALGDDRLAYLGFSYGARLGSVYAHEFPEHTGRMVLDGVPDPTLDDVDTALGQAAAFQHSLADFAADCASRGCPVPGGTGPEVMAGIEAVGRGLDGGGVATVTGQLDHDGFLQGLQNALYSTDAWPQLREALGALRGGDGEPMMQLAYPGQLGELVPGVLRAPGWSTPDNYEMAKLAIDCRDQPERRTEAGVHRLDRRFTAASPVFGAEIEATLLACTGWPPGDGAPRRVAAPTAPQALLVSTTADPATPYPGAAHMAAAMRNSSVVLTRHGDGHGGYFAHSPCVTSAVDAYLINGELPAPTTRC
jgi:pimeloyl-ACP methyl ester carboxylesterase